MKCWQKENGKIYDVCDLLVGLDLAKSRTEARRLILQGAVKIDNRKVSDPNAIINVKHLIKC